MRASTVHNIVHGIADAAHVQAIASRLQDENAALRLRVQALETVINILAEALLDGTSADPHARKGKL